MIVLPTTPSPADLAWSKASNDHADLTPLLPGETTRLFRNGRGKRSVTATMPKMRNQDAIAWIADLESAGEVTLRLPQPGVDTTGAGVVRVNGANQVGTTLNVDGLPAGHVLKKGRLLSLTAGGVSFCYRLATQAVANGGGAAALLLTTPIRRSPADNEVVEVENPVIAGLLGGDAGNWTLEVARTVGLVFTVSERV